MGNLLENASKRYKVKSKFLHLLIEGGKYNEDISIDGYTNHGNEGFARFALERLTRYAFNIKRFPGYEDRTVFKIVPHDSFKLFGQWTDFFENTISEDEIDEAIEEIINIYNHIQEQLKGRNTITCYRGLQPYDYLQFVNKLESVMEPKESLSYKANTIVSFRDKKELYYNNLTIKVKIPVKNILMHYAFIETEESYHRNDGLPIENEILYLNDDIKGMFTFNREDILNWERMKKDYNFLSTITGNKNSGSAEPPYRLLNINDTYHQNFFYDQVYCIYLKDYKDHVLNQLSPRFRKKVEKELEYL